MKLKVQGEVAAGIPLAHSIAHPADQPTEHADGGRRKVRRGQPRAGNFQNRPRLVPVFDGIQLKLGDDGAAPRRETDQPLLGQPAQFLANRPAAEAEDRGEARFHQPLPGRHLASDDAARDLIFCGVGERRKRPHAAAGLLVAGVALDRITVYGILSSP